MPNLRDKTWTPTTPAQTADAQFWEDHLIDDASYEGLQEILEGGGGGGHVIQNPSGTEMPQQPVLQFVNATVTNGDGKTIVSGNGEKGDAATVTVGTVTTGAAGTNAQVTNSGTQYDAVLDFVIPRGADGSGSGLPSGGTNGQVLYKDTSASTGGAWGDLPDSVLSVNGETPDAQGNVDVVALPTGGTAGQTLIKQSSAEGDAQWEDIKALPTGGTAGQFLVKASSDYGDSAWETKEVVLTQAEYDALPNTKLTDGVSYFITDGESAPSTNKFSARGISYDNTDSGLSATNVQDAVDELSARFELQKGTYLLGGIYAAHSTGSGNYITFGLPYKLADDISNASLANISASIYIDDQSVMRETVLDTTYCGLTKYALCTMIELKFKSTQVADKMATVRISGGTITFS